MSVHNTTDMLETLTPPERHLIAELAVGMARRLEAIVSKTGDTHPLGPGFVHDSAQSTFEIACDVLWRLGVAHGANLPPPKLSKRGCKSWRQHAQEAGADEIISSPAFYKPLPSDAIRTALASIPPEAAVRETTRPVPSLDEILPAYLGVACGFGPLSSGRERFVPPPEFAREIDALVSLGYMERRGSAVIWTDKIELAMHEALIWLREEAPPDALDADPDEELKAVLGATPDETKRLLTEEAQRMSEIDFTVLLRDRFDGLYWRKYPDETPRPRPDVWLPKRVYAFLRTR